MSLALAADSPQGQTLRLDVTFNVLTLPTRRFLWDAPTRNFPISALINQIFNLLDGSWKQVLRPCDFVAEWHRPDDGDSLECPHFKETFQILRDMSRVFIRQLTPSEVQTNYFTGRFSDVNGVRYIDGVMFGSLIESHRLPLAYVPANDPNVNNTQNHQQPPVLTDIPATAGQGNHLVQQAFAAYASAHTVSANPSSESRTDSHTRSPTTTPATQATQAAQATQTSATPATSMSTTSIVKSIQENQRATTTQTKPSDESRPAKRRKHQVRSQFPPKPHPGWSREKRESWQKDLKDIYRQKGYNVSHYDSDGDLVRVSTKSGDQDTSSEGPNELPIQKLSKSKETWMHSKTERALSTGNELHAEGSESESESDSEDDEPKALPAPAAISSDSDDTSSSSDSSSDDSSSDSSSESDSESSDPEETSSRPPTAVLTKTQRRNQRRRIARKFQASERAAQAAPADINTIQEAPAARDLETMRAAL